MNTISIKLPKMLDEQLARPFNQQKIYGRVRAVAWNDLVEFEIIPVRRSAEASALIALRLYMHELHNNFFLEKTYYC